MRDKKLLEEYRRTHSDEAFARIVARYVNPVFSTCLREVNDRQTAEDVTQAVFLLLARKISTLNPNVALSGWLFNASRLVARNALREEQRRRAREKKAALMQPDSESSQWNAIDGELNEALAALNAGDRLTILLRYFDELSMAEIAQEFGISPDAAHMRVRRALDRLRVILAKQGTAIPAVTLAALLTSGAVKVASTEVAASIVPGSAAVGAGVTTIVEVAMKQMWLAQLKTALCVSACAVIGIGTVGTYSHRFIAGGPAPTPSPAVSSTAGSSPAGAMLAVRPVVRGPIGPDGTNTYHLAGSIMLDGKAAPWEIWGRRKPYFYYERKGQDVTQDDGVTMLRVYGPDPSWKREGFVAVITKSEAERHTVQSGLYLINPMLLTDASSWQILTNPLSWHDGVPANHMQPVTRTGDGMIFEASSSGYVTVPDGNSTRSWYTVAANDDTLRRYQLHLTMSNGALDVQTADVEYGNPVPGDILQPRDTSRVTTYDLRPNVPDSLTAMDVSILPLAVDADGNILVEAKPANKLLLESMFECPTTVDVVCRDAGGKTSNVRYLNLYFNTTPPGNVIVLSPLEPLPAGYRPVSIAPTGFYLKLSVTHPRPSMSLNGLRAEFGPMRDDLGMVAMPGQMDLQGVGLSLEPYAARLEYGLANGDFHAKLTEFIAKQRVAYDREMQVSHGTTSRK